MLFLAKSSVSFDELPFLRTFSSSVLVDFVSLFSEKCSVLMKPVLAWEREARAKGIVRGRGGDCQRAGGGGECKGMRAGARW